MDRKEFVKFLVSKVSGEGEDSKIYSIWADRSSNKEISATLTAIAHDEETHREKILQILGTLAMEEPHE